MLGSDEGYADPGPDMAPSQAAIDPLASLYKAQAPRLLRLLRLRARGSEDAADLIQEAFARLASRGPLGLLGNPEAYLQRIVRNLLIDRSRRRANRVDHCPIGPDLEIAVPPDQAQRIEADDVKRQYRRAVDALPPRMRQVFLMHRLDELTYDAIAGQLGISCRTVEWHIGEALTRIGRALKPDD